MPVFPVGSGEYPKRLEVETGEPHDRCVLCGGSRRAALDEGDVGLAFFKAGNVFNRSFAGQKFDVDALFSQSFFIALAKDMIGAARVAGGERQAARRGRFDELIGQNQGGGDQKDSASPNVQCLFHRARFFQGLSDDAGLTGHGFQIVQ